MEPTLVAMDFSQWIIKFCYAIYVVKSSLKSFRPSAKHQFPSSFPEINSMHITYTSSYKVVTFYFSSCLYNRIGFYNIYIYTSSKAVFNILVRYRG